MVLLPTIFPLASRNLMVHVRQAHIPPVQAILMAGFLKAYLALSPWGPTGKYSGILCPGNLGAQAISSEAPSPCLCHKGTHEPQSLGFRLFSSHDLPSASGLHRFH